MRRLIALLVLGCCVSCAQTAAARQPTSTDGGKVSNRAALVPATVELPASSSATPIRLSTPSAGPTATPIAWNLIMLTRGGCCPGAFWSPDSQEVRFLARPEPTQPASIYAVPRTGGPAKLVRREPAYFSPDGAYSVTVSGEDIVIVRVGDGKRWTIATGGRGVTFSHSKRFVAWTAASDAFTNLNLIQRTIWVSDLDGGQTTSIVQVVGGGFLGWAEDDEAVLVSGGLITGGPRGVWRVGVAGGDPELLFEAAEVQSALISPDGGWLAFFVAFGSQPDRNGLWVMRTQDGSANLLDLFGSYRWRGEGRLLIIPLEINQPGDAVWEYAAAGDSATRLFGPGDVPFEVANNDWSVSPDGAYVAFRSGVDLNIWTLALPED